MSTTATLLESAHLVAQGAEAKVYKANLGSNPVLLKHRFTKKYRNSALDASLTKQRVAGEARALLRCLRFGVSVPGIRFVHADTGLLGIEWIEGTSVRKVLGGGAEGEDETEEQSEQETEAQPEIDELKEVYNLTQERMMTLIGEEIAKMHKSAEKAKKRRSSYASLDLPHIISFIPSSQTAQVLIDFGLSFNSTLVEDKAVDLYVLERAFASTHPGSEGMFGQVLQAYEQVSEAAWKNVKKRLDEVRLRGRKRSMVG
ncbi:Serine/threonine-protein kinase [Ceratobasidium theobromae]|uniref:non-specific serine/threonine protein kinase n=1 Tax=Ceratobasidium theobromae TaxID=1582974 RepID=A0A5N5QBW8_9AGAM|nr:Serine/threonine-protein kinase [Ceratobasidium theobromae]